MRREKRFRWLLWSCFCAAVLALALPGLGQVQSAPVTEPRGASSESATTVAKGAAAISQQHEKCSTRLVVDADALFAPHRWTLNPDASTTLDLLGPMIVKAGTHTVEIFAQTSAADSDNENRDVSHRRVVTVRTWLANHGFVPADIATTESNPDKHVGPPARISSSPGSERPRNNGSVEVVIATCR